MSSSHDHLMMVALQTWQMLIQQVFMHLPSVIYFQLLTLQFSFSLPFHQLNYLKNLLGCSLRTPIYSLLALQAFQTLVLLHIHWKNFHPLLQNYDLLSYLNKGLFIDFKFHPYHLLSSLRLNFLQNSYHCSCLILHYFLPFLHLWNLVWTFNYPLVLVYWHFLNPFPPFFMNNYYWVHLLMKNRHPFLQRVIENQIQQIPV